MSLKEIPLSRGGYVAIVDEDDFEHLMQFKWHVLLGHRGPYARRNVGTFEGKRVGELMHRHLLPAAPSVDHINGDGLDNRRSNLRAATARQNARNRRGPRANNISGYRGVSACSGMSRKWQARIQLPSGAELHLGTFVTAEEAARVFDSAAIEHYGEFHGYLNFLNERRIP